MAISAVVFDAIKKMSKRTVNPLHRILFIDIASELKLSLGETLLLLKELEYAGYIKIHNTKVVSVTLTEYGASQECL